MAYRDKLAKKADLEGGEEVLAAAMATPAGGIRRNAMSAGAGATMGVIGSAAKAAVQQATDRSAPDPDPSFPTTSKMVIGLTDRRVLVWALSSMTGALKEQLVEIPVSSVRDIAWGEGKTMGMRNGVLELTLVDGSVASMEIPRVHIKDGEALATLLRGMLHTVN